MEFKDFLQVIFYALLFLFPLWAVNVAGGMASDDTYISPEYVGYCEAAGEEFRISPELLESIIEHESSGNAAASNGRCKGLMQVYESVHVERMARLGVSSLYDPEGNIRVAASILVELFERSDDCAWVLMSYNGSSDARRRAEGFDFTGYAKSVMDRAYELEELHGKHDYREYLQDRNAARHKNERREDIK